MLTLCCLVPASVPLRNYRFTPGFGLEVDNQSQRATYTAKHCFGAN